MAYQKQTVISTIKNFDFDKESQNLPKPQFDIFKKHNEVLTLHFYNEDQLSLEYLLKTYILG